MIYEYDPRRNDWSHVNDQRKYAVYKNQKDPCLVGFFSYFNLSKFFNYHISSSLDDFFFHVLNVSRIDHGYLLQLMTRHNLIISSFFLVVHKIKMSFSWQHLRFYEIWKVWSLFFWTSKTPYISFLCNIYFTLPVLVMSVKYYIAKSPRVKKAPESLFCFSTNTLNSSACRRTAIKIAWIKLDSKQDINYF